MVLMRVYAAPEMRASQRSEPPVSPPSGGGLFARAAYLGIPIHKSAERIVAPRPYVEFIERRNIESVRAGNELEALAFEHRRPDVGGVPRGLIHDEFDTHQLQLSIGWLIDERLGMGWVQGSIEKRAIHIVNAHGAHVRAADTTEELSVAGRFRSVDIGILLCGVLDDLDEFGGGVSVSGPVSGGCGCREMRHESDEAAE